MRTNVSYIIKERMGHPHLYYLAPIANIPSIMKYGLLSHNKVAYLQHEDVSNTDVQLLRHRTVINWTDGSQTKLHDYVNLYFDAHNPMLSAIRSRNNSICILQIDYGVIDLAGTVISDCNAATGMARFFNPIDAIDRLDYQTIVDAWWTNKSTQAQIDYCRRTKCAEVLVYDNVGINNIRGAIVCNDMAYNQLAAVGFSWPISIDRSIFF